MKKLPLTAVMLGSSLLTGCMSSYPTGQQALAPRPSVGSGLGSGNVALNAYGLGMGMDQYGRAVPHDPQLQVTPNAYGLGVGMDQYGRPVQ